MRLHIAACVVLVSSTALAQPAPSPQFDREYNAGIDAYRLGKYAEARDHLEKAKAFEPKLPGPYRYLAAVDQAEQKYADCIEHARTAIELNPQSKELPETIKLHDACRASAGKPTFELSKDSTGGAISVTANVEAASVTLNGLKYGATPLAPREVVAGPADIGVTKQGYLPATKKVDVIAGIVTDIDFTLEKDPSYKEPDNGTGGAKPSVPTTGFLAISGVPDASVKLDGKPIAFTDGRFETDPGVHEVEVAAPGMEGWRRRVRIARGQKTTIEVSLTSSDARASSHGMGLTFASIGAVLAIGAAGTGIYSYRQAEIAHDWTRIEQDRPSNIPIAQTGAALPVHTRADIQAQSDKATTWGYVSDAALGAAIVTTGIGVYYLLKDRPDERPGQPAPFAIAPIIGHGDTGFVIAKAVQW
jgi:hypothetical protein